MSFLALDRLKTMKDKLGSKLKEFHEPNWLKPDFLATQHKPEPEMR